MRRADVVRRRDQHAGDVAQLNGLLHLQRGGHVIAGKAHHHLMGGRHLQHGVEHRQLFFLAQRGGFTGRAADHQAVDAGVEQVPRQAFNRRQIDGILIERGNHRHPNTRK